MDWSTPDGVRTSSAFGTVLGAAVQCGSALAEAHTPKSNPPGVGRKPRAWSDEKPFWPVSTTVNPQPGLGVPPRLAVGTLNVMYREIALAEMAIVPTVVVFDAST